ncbi:dTDP-4-dehydrorhamnose reductase family protein [Rossellomorea sp. BNER]|uniref:dTDP-4-dehydrorhamnose reductase family protein n=1 Tax=Rossellomorea sp. BNER TaxID=2962031 RepID=UPI003AF30D04|nr:SDR family oxidoreductase [Rossellomorea sp. BNER]
MKIFILGGLGMAGHIIVDYLDGSGHSVSFSARDEGNHGGVALDVRDIDKVKEYILVNTPDIVINAVGLLNENAENHIIDAIKVNSLLPHFLVDVLDTYGGKLIQISSDCVFSGNKGSYKEDDKTDGSNVYSKSKSLGEVRSAPHLTIRTSIIGPELKKNGIGLLQWFLKQSGTIKGFEQVYWNGVTTLELAKAIDKLIENKVTGIYHLCTPERISKYQLLLLFKEAFNKQDVSIIPSSYPAHDRTLVHTRLDYKYIVNDYPTMLKEIYEWMNSR